MSCLVEACWKLKSCVQSYLATPRLTAAAAAGRPAKKTARPGSLTKPRITCRETPSRRAFSFAPLQSCIIASRFFGLRRLLAVSCVKIPRFISVQRVYSGSVCMCCLSRLYDLRPAEGEKATRAHRTRFPLVSVSPRRLGCSMPPKVVLGGANAGWCDDYLQTFCTDIGSPLSRCVPSTCCRNAHLQHDASVFRDLNERLVNAVAGDRQFEAALRFRRAADEDRADRIVDFEHLQVD